MNSVSTLRNFALCLAFASPGALAFPPAPSDIALMDATALNAALHALDPQAPQHGDAARVARGAILIRLGEHTAGLRAFANAVSPEHIPAVQYYRGVAAEALGEYQLASDLFEAAADQDDDLAIQALADDALLALAYVPRVAPRSAEPKHFGLISLGSFTTTGLVDPVRADGIDTTDHAAEVALSGSVLAWQPGPETQLRITGNYFTQRYSDLDQYNLGLANASARLAHRTGHQLWSISAGVTDLRLGGEAFMDYRDLSLGLTQAIANGWAADLRLRLRAVQSSQTAFAHLDGDDTQLRVQVRNAASPWEFTYAYGVEDRDDRGFVDSFANGDPFSGFNSFSRSVHQLEVNLEHSWRHDRDQSFTLGYRVTQHNDPERILLDDIAVISHRDASRTNLGTTLSWRATERLILKVDLERLDEDADVATYSFDSTQLSVGLEYVF